VLQLKLGWDISQKCNILRLAFHFKMSHNISSSTWLLGEGNLYFQPSPALPERAGAEQDSGQAGLSLTAARHGSSAKPWRRGARRGIFGMAHPPGAIPGEPNETIRAVFSRRQVETRLQTLLR